MYQTTDSHGTDYINYSSNHLIWNLSIPKGVKNNVTDNITIVATKLSKY